MDQFQRPPSDRVPAPRSGLASASFNGGNSVRGFFGLARRFGQSEILFLRCCFCRLCSSALVAFAAGSDLKFEHLNARFYFPLLYVYSHFILSKPPKYTVRLISVNPVLQAQSLAKFASENTPCGSGRSDSSHLPLYHKAVAGEMPEMSKLRSTRRPRFHRPCQLDSAMAQRILPHATAKTQAAVCTSPIRVSQPLERRELLGSAYGHDQRRPLPHRYPNSSIRA